MSSESTNDDTSQPSGTATTCTSPSLFGDSSSYYSQDVSSSQPTSLQDSSQYYSGFSTNRENGRPMSACQPCVVFSIVLYR